MSNVHMHAGAVRKLLYICAYVREIIHPKKLVDYLPVRTHKPYNDLHVNFENIWISNCTMCSVATVELSLDCLIQMVYAI